MSREVFDKKKAVFARKISNAVKKFEKAQIVVEDLQKEEKSLRSAVDTYQQLDTEIRVDGAKVIELMESLSRVKRAIDELKGEASPHLKRIKAFKESIKAAVKILKKDKKRAKELRVDAEMFGFWKAGFRDLRLWLIDEVLTELGMSINSSIEDLGLEGWYIELAVERESSSSGNIIKGFQVIVHPPNGNSRGFVGNRRSDTLPATKRPAASGSGGVAAPWSSYSGGETQRLRIAGNIGLANLIASRAGLAVDFEIWDEPTAHLSEEGIDDMVDLFVHRGRSKQVWLIDHHTLDNGEFDGQLIVRKLEESSHLQLDLAEGGGSV